MSGLLSSSQSRANIMACLCRDKENETPDLEEFGYLKLHTTSTCPNRHQHSPSKESPSRRVRLMGSLKRIGSFRNIRSSPLKERGPEQAGCISDGDVSDFIHSVRLLLRHRPRVLVRQTAEPSRRSHSTSRSLRRISPSLKSFAAGALFLPV